MPRRRAGPSRSGEDFRPYCDVYPHVICQQLIYIKVLLDRCIQNAIWGDSRVTSIKCWCGTGACDMSGQKWSEAITDTPPKWHPFCLVTPHRHTAGLVSFLISSKAAIDRHYLQGSRISTDRVTYQRRCPSLLLCFSHINRLAIQLAPR